MDSTKSWLVVLGLALGTFLIRYSFIGIFSNRTPPPWLASALRLMVPAIFSAIICGGVVMVNGQMAGPTEWPRYAAAAVGLVTALLTRGSMLITVAAGMTALHALPWLVSTI